jgi:hypothetical protein
MFSKFHLKNVPLLQVLQTTVYFKPNKKQSDRIEKIQKRIIKFIYNKLGKYNLKYKYNERLELLKLKSLKHRSKL